MMTPWRKYTIHRSHAEKRGIGFELTFDEWMKIWEESGHWHERGNKKGQYVMARYGDKGPYAIGNVKIITFEDNVRERKYVYTDEVRAKMSKPRSKKREFRSLSPEHKLNLSVSLMGKKHLNRNLPRWYSRSNMRKIED